VRATHFARGQVAQTNRESEGGMARADSADSALDVSLFPDSPVDSVTPIPADPPRRGRLRAEDLFSDGGGITIGSAAVALVRNAGTLLNA
jgi:hypothetical protein